MTTLSDLITATIEITGRPDLTTLITRSIFKATIKEHSAVDYPRDLAAISPIALPASSTNRYQLSLLTLGLATSLRKISKIAEAVTPVESPIYTGAGYYGQIQFTEVSPNNLFDGYAMEVYDYFYRQGDTINIASSRAVANVALLYYAMPVITVEAYASWIADLYPYVIYEHAASDVFKAVGKDDEAATYRAKLPDNRMDIIRSEIGAI